MTDDDVFAQEHRASYLFKLRRVDDAVAVLITRLAASATGGSKFVLRRLRSGGAWRYHFAAAW